MAPPSPPPHTYTTPKKRKRDNHTSDAGNDSDSDYNPRKTNHKLKPKPKSSAPAARNQSIVKTSTSLPQVNGDGNMRDATDGEERSDVQLPTPPKISLFSKFVKKAKKTEKESTSSSSQNTSVGYGSQQSALSFGSPQQPPSSTSTFTFATQASILRSSKPIPVTNLLATHQTRSATGSLPSNVVPNYTELSLPSLGSSDFVADLLGQPSSPRNPFRILAPTKSTLSKGQKQPGGSATDTPPVKPSGIKLRFNLKAKKTPAKTVTFKDTPSVVPSPDTSSQESKSSYIPPVFGSGNSCSILKTRYQSSPPGSQPSPESTPYRSQGSFLSRLSTSQQSHGSFGTPASREPTLEDRLVSALQAELGSDFGESDIHVPLLGGIVNKNVASPDSDDGSDCDIDADILTEVEAEEAEMNNDAEIRALHREWQPSSDLAYNLYIADHEELTTTAQKLYWLQMQAQWAERGGVKNSFLTGVDTEILHLEGLKLRLEQKISFILNLGGVANGAANDVDGEQAALQVKQEKLSPPSVPKIVPTFFYES